MKKIISILFILVAIFNIYAVPGFNSYIKDTSGEYVYYKDKSFVRESYIGILYYDEGTYQIRYYAPQDKTNLLPEKDISILLTVNTSSTFWDMTGEKILGAVLTESEDIEIVNYLHDFLYEFSSRRNKISELSNDDKDYIQTKNFKENGFKSTQDFSQFGGKVTIVFDNLIPVFNIKSIIDVNMKEVLETCITGQLISSSDNSFSQFKGFPEPLKKNKKDVKEQKKAKTTIYKYNGKKIVLDSNWKQDMENIWLLGDDSVITISSIPFYSNNESLNNAYIIRKMIQSSGGSYINLSNLELSFDTKKKSYKITSYAYQQESKKTIRNTKIIYEGPIPSETEGFIRDGKQINFFSISTYETAYDNNPSYFDKIVRSYK